jgi:hypothetical protein
MEMGFWVRKFVHQSDLSQSSSHVQEGEFVRHENRSAGAFSRGRSRYKIVVCKGMAEQSGLLSEEASIYYTTNPIFIHSQASFVGASLFW